MNMANKSQRKYRINLRPYRILYFPLLFPIALLLALFNKISPIPFKIYPIRVERVGQMASNQEEFLCELEHGKYPKEFRVYVHRDHPSNTVLLNLLKRAMYINQLFLPLFDVCHKLGGLGVTSLALQKMTGYNTEHLPAISKQHIDFTDPEEKEAKRQCHGLGIDPDEPFVPVLGRDTAYLEDLGEPTLKTNYRNVDINTFIPAMEYIADRFQVVRLGSVVKDSLNTSHPNIIDYSLSGKRTELLDIYLSGRCHFFMSCGTGLDALPLWSFRLPVLQVNFIPPSYISNLSDKTVVILKNYWSIKENRPLSMSEFFQLNVSDACDADLLKEIGVVVYDNSPEEIRDAATEMVERLEGTWEETPEDIKRQERFWETYLRNVGDVKYGAKIGSAFLKSNPHWLE